MVKSVTISMFERVSIQSKPVPKIDFINTNKRKMYDNAIKKLVKLSDYVQSRISAFEEKRRIDLSILSSTTMHICKKCSKILSLDKFKLGTCACGEKISEISQIKKITVYHFNNRLINFLERNYWFEHGIDYILRRKNLQTLVGYNVLGHSGIWHEIDNIADSKNENFRFFCECKNGEVTVNDIFIFSGKMIDVGCPQGFVFTTSKKVSDEVNRLARSKTIIIKKDVLTRGTTSLLNMI